MFTNYRHETGHRNVLPDPKPHLIMLIDSGIAGPREAGSPVPVPDPETLPFAKAFDKVPHQRLLHKTDSYGISGNVAACIGEWLHNRKQKVVLNEENSRLQDVDILVMDFAKAFGKVCHSLLIHKLHHYGIRGKINSWIENWLANRTQSVVIDPSQLAWNQACHKDQFSD